MDQEKIEAYKKILCKKCQKKIVEPLIPLSKQLEHRSRVKRLSAKVKLAKLHSTLYLQLCNKCLSKMKTQIPKIGQ